MNNDEKRKVSSASPKSTLPPKPLRPVSSSESSPPLVSAQSPTSSVSPLRTNPSDTATIQFAPLDRRRSRGWSQWHGIFMAVSILVGASLGTILGLLLLSLMVNKQLPVARQEPSTAPRVRSSASASVKSPSASEKSPSVPEKSKSTPEKSQSAPKKASHPVASVEKKSTSTTQSPDAKPPAEAEAPAPLHEEASVGVATVIIDDLPDSVDLPPADTADAVLLHPL